MTHKMKSKLDRQHHILEINKEAGLNENNAKESTLTKVHAMCCKLVQIQGDHKVFP